MYAGNMEAHSHTHTPAHKIPWYLHHKVPTAISTTNLLPLSLPITPRLVPGQVPTLQRGNEGNAHS